MLRGEFAALWVASTQSTLGDQLARVALSVLVFERTGSGFATAAVYALTFLPELVSSVVLGHLADRLPRRGVLVAGDGLRAVLLGVMALPGTPVWAVSGLLVVAVLVAGPWRAAERALVADIIRGEDYVLGVGLRTATTQAMQLIGFAAGGVVVAIIGPRSGLAVDAATFAMSALIIQLSIRDRPALDPSSGRRPRRWFTGAVTVLGDPAMRALLLYSWLVGLLIVPEGLAAPYAAELGAGPRTVGVLLAAIPAGVLAGSVWFSRFVGPGLRARLLTPLAIASGVPLIGCAARPGLVVTVVLWAAAGACTCFMVQVQAEFIGLVPNAIRGQAIAVASGGLLGAQGIGVLGGGALTAALAPSSCVAIAGTVTLASAVLLAGVGARTVG